MVKKEAPVYLLVRSLGPSERIRELKDRYLNPSVVDFNLDTLFARELTLAVFQERLLCLPVRATKRIIIVKNAEQLRPELRKYVLAYLREPSDHVILVLEVENPDSRDEFLQSLSQATATPLPGQARLDTFALSRQIDQGKPATALKVLHQLLGEGERPERILGGLRYVFENRTDSKAAQRRRLKLLLMCDLDIKTGRLKPETALEKLLVHLCYLKKS